MSEEKYEIEESLLVCLKIERMTQEPIENDKCFVCGAVVGYTKASKLLFDKEKNKKFICLQCFCKRKLKAGDEIVAYGGMA